MHNTLPGNGMYDVSRDLLKLWEINYNISLTVKDRYTVAMEH